MAIRYRGTRTLENSIDIELGMQELSSTFEYQTQCHLEMKEKKTALLSTNNVTLHIFEPTFFKWLFLLGANDSRSA